MNVSKKNDSKMVKATFQEVMFDLYDVSYSGKLPSEFTSWKEFGKELAQKLGDIEAALFDKGDEV